jgi:hypothetical protein
MKRATAQIAGNPASGKLARKATRFSALCIVLTFFGAILFQSSHARADAPKYDAAALSDSAFALLSSVNADPVLAGALLAPVASLASDAQSLAGALQSGDETAASHAMAALIADRGMIDSAAAKSPHPLDPSRWSSIKKQIAALAMEVNPVAGPVGPAVPPASASASPGASEPPAAAPGAPQIVVTSRAYSNGGVRVKGYFEGTDLKTAGIFDGDQEMDKIKVDDPPGAQRVKFDFTLEAPSPSQSLRVTDDLGREATALVAPQAAEVAHSDDGHEKLIELGGGVREDDAASAVTNGPMRESSTSTTLHNSNIAEIPSAGARGSEGTATGLVGVQINILGVMPSMAQPGSYEVIGQISGPGIHRAGIYVDGRLAKPIPLDAGAYSAFDVTFPMRGKAATIRAYGVGSNFAETSIDLTDGANTSVYSGTPVYPNPYGYNPYAPRRPYPYGYGPPPYGAPGYGYAPPGYGYPPPGYGSRPPASSPWWKKIIP